MSLEMRTEVASTKNNVIFCEQHNCSLGDCDAVIQRADKPTTGTLDDPKRI
jgi:hypothetical protein